MKAAPLTAAEVKAALKTLPGWKHSRKRLVKTFQFKDFKKAFRFMTAIAKVANQMNHHPEWSNVYNQVEVALRTHDLKNQVGPLDVQMAQAMNRQFAK